MRTRQVTERIGERMGDIDYSYNFQQHYDHYCCDRAQQEKMCYANIERLKECERRFKAGESLQVRYGDYWHDLLDVGMYDGWPYWTPTPAIYYHNTLGGEWHFWYNIDEIRTKSK